MRSALAFLRRDFLIETSYRFAFVMQTFGIAFNIATFYFIARLLGNAVSPYLQSYGGDYFAFVLIGLAFTGYFSVGLYGFVNGLRQAQMTGTLEAMLMTPTNAATIIAASSLWEYVMTTLRVVAYLLIGTLGLGVNLGHANYFAAFVVLLFAVAIFNALGIMAASIVLVTKRGDPVTYLFGAFFNLLGGVFYPVSVMPEFLQRVADFIPITYALRALRLTLLQGASFEMIATDLIVLVLFAIVLLPASLIAFRFGVAFAKRDGSLTHY
jgi:ABC-2 type transport system permease protein